ncbi:alpha-glucosidase, partial [Xanthomonas citri pv. citri]|nr:alpha-glucosidase [Xanthomonas citri pv. citri]
YHQCRWGYDTVESLETVVENFKKFDIPLETIWSDIDYMDGYKDFTNDPHRFPLDKYRKFLDDIHNNSQHYVPIFDAAIYVPNPNNATDNDYEPFHLGNESDVFLKNPDGSLY